MLYVCLFSLAVLGLFAVSGGSAAAADDDHPQVVLETNQGNITIELDRTKAPISVENFLKYVDSGHYNGTIFHRVIKDFMIQGGGMTEKMSEKDTNSPIKNEAGNGLRNLRGTLAMARTGNPNSATAQFFVNLKDNDFLDKESPRRVDPYGYAVFGKVVAGMDVVDKIGAGRTSGQDVPVETVVIESAKRKPKS